jgi:hypothetical protein
MNVYWTQQLVEERNEVEALQTATKVRRLACVVWCLWAGM